MKQKDYLMSIAEIREQEDFIRLVDYSDEEIHQFLETCEAEVLFNLKDSLENPGIPESV
jgi:hypothetical protein